VVGVVGVVGVVSWASATPVINTAIAPTTIIPTIPYLNHLLINRVPFSNYS
jgi:hypothetical protein